MIEENISRHDRRRDRTRKQLQDAMLDLVLDRGYESIVIQDITDLADVGRGTFYFHFESKESLLWSIVEERFPWQETSPAHRLDEELPDQPEYYSYVNRFRQFEKSKMVFLAALGSKGSQAVAKRVRESIAEGVFLEMEKFNLYQEIGQSPEVVAQIVASLLTSLAVWWLQNSIPLTAVQMGGIIYKTLHHQEPPGGTWQEGVAR